MASFRKRGDLQWQARIYRKGYPSQVKTFNTRSEAEAWARQAESEMDRGHFVSRTEAENTSLEEVLERYRREVTPGKRGQQSENYIIDFYLRLPIAKRMMATIRSTDVAALRDEWLKKVKPATVNRRLSVLSHVFNVSRREWGMESLINPLELVRKPIPNNSRTRRLLDDDRTLKRGVSELEWIRQASESDALPTILELAIETAMRRGEIAALKWEHVDLESQVAHLPKTKNGTARDVPLSSRAVTILRDLPRNQIRVFDMRADAITRAFIRARDRARTEYERACAKANIKPDRTFLADLHLHDLRHEATSRLADYFPLHELTRITGHLDPRMLMRYYHPKASDLARKMDAMKAAKEG